MNGEREQQRPPPLRRKQLGHIRCKESHQIRRRTITVGACGFFFSSRRRHTRLQGDWSSDVCSSDLEKSGLSSPASNCSVTNAITEPSPLTAGCCTRSRPLVLSGTGRPALSTPSTSTRTVSLLGLLMSVEMIAWKVLKLHWVVLLQSRRYTVWNTM